MTGALPGSCSLVWDDPQLPAWGTAAPSGFIVAVEQPGAWGAKVFTESGLDPVLGAAFEAACDAAGGRALLIRTPSAHHPDLHQAGPRRVLVAGGFAGEPWLVEGEVADVADLLDLPFDRFAAWTPDAATAALGWPLAPAALLVCTNSKRDVCCAITGRRIADAAAETHPGLVWEVSHLGGHRFAPTALVLPVGVALGRLTPTIARDALDAAASGLVAAASLDERHWRGRVCLPAAPQVADAAVRFAISEPLPAALRVESAGDASGVAPAHAFVVRHSDGRVWRTEVTSQIVPPDRPVSCGKPGEPSAVWRVEITASAAGE